MNNIEQLIGKALDTAVPYTWHHLNRVQVDDVMREFARLIVRDCADIANEPGARIPGYYVKKHFGVEE